MPLHVFLGDETDDECIPWGAFVFRFIITMEVMAFHILRTCPVLPSCIKVSCGLARHMEG
jgi:hypothetical protein